MTRRGQSETVGVVMLLAITVVGTTAIVMFGATALNETESNMRTSNVENSMKQLDARASRVAIGGSNAQSVTIPQEGDATLRADSDRGWINVSVTNQDTGATTTIVNRTLGVIVYERGGKTVAYQGGGVWRHAGNNTVMLSSPEFHFQGQTLTLPIITIEQDGELAENVRVEGNGSAERVFPGSTSFTNPISGRKQVNVTIHSAFYDGWAAFLRERAGGVVTVDHENETVTIELVTERAEEGNRIEAGVFSTTSGSATTIDVDNGAFIASYRSSEYDNSDPGDTIEGNRNNSSVALSGELKLNSGGAHLKGDAQVGDTVTLSTDNVWITGHLTCHTGNATCLDNVDDRIDAVDTGSNVGSEPPPLDDGPTGDVTNTSDPLPEPRTVEEIFNFTVSAKIDDLQHNNDNGNASAIDNSTNELKSGDQELGPGSYYLQNLDVEEDTIKLNISEGNITLGVDGQFKLVESAQLCIVYEDKHGDHQVQMFLADSGSTDIKLDSGGDVLTDDNDNLGDADLDCTDEGSTGDPDWDGTNPYNGTKQSNKFWVYAPSGIEGRFMQRTDFTGVLYAPDTPSETADIHIHGGRIYGAVVAMVTDMDENNRVGAIFYDTWLESATASSSVSAVQPVKVSYLHVSVTELNVSSSGG